MPSYRAYFLNERYRIADSEDFDESSDGVALARAKLLLGSRHGFKDFELWQDCRAIRLVRRTKKWLESA